MLKFAISLLVRNGSGKFCGGKLSHEFCPPHDFRSSRSGSTGSSSGSVFSSRARPRLPLRLLFLDYQRYSCMMISYLTTFDLHVIQTPKNLRNLNTNLDCGLKAGVWYGILHACEKGKGTHYCADFNFPIPASNFTTHFNPLLRHTRATAVI